MSFTLDKRLAGDALVVGDMAHFPRRRVKGLA
jgi:hypothetical protein